MKTAILVGSGHLSMQTGRKLEDKGFNVVRIEPGIALQELSLEYCKSKLEAAQLGQADKVFIVDQEDRVNIQFALAAVALNKNVPIVMTLFNEKIAPHFRLAHSNLRIENPARIAAPHFIEALKTPVTHRTAVNIIPEKQVEKKLGWLRSNKGLVSVAVFFLALLTTVSIFFHSSENLTWVNTIYFVITMATTTGFGDISLLNSSVLAKIVGAATMVLSLASISIFFSLLVDRLIRRRAELMLGHKKYDYSGHVILCGLGRLGYQIAEALIEQNEKLVVIEQDENSKFLDTIRAHGVDVFIGDATLPKNLRDAGIEKAQALISVINDDLANLEVGLNARSLYPDTKLILRIFDRDTAKEIKNQLDIHLALSTSAIAAEQLVD